MDLDLRPVDLSRETVAAEIARKLLTYLLSGKIKPGAVSDQVWAFWDFLPTAAEIGGLKPPEGLDVYYRNHVVGGEGHVTIESIGFDNFRQAILQKLLLEIG